jgi:hypothetical protein
VCSKRVGSITSTSGVRCIDLVTIPMISHEKRMDRILRTTSVTLSYSFVTDIPYRLAKYIFIIKENKTVTIFFLHNFDYFDISLR